MSQYKRYSIDEIKRKIIRLLESNNTGLTGNEISKRAGINRVTMTKYLDILDTMGLIKKKMIGNVNIWVLENGVESLTLPIDYLEIQQILMNLILTNKRVETTNFINNILHSDIKYEKLVLDILIPISNTIGDLYNRGRIGKTEKIVLMTHLIDITNFVGSFFKNNKLNQEIFVIIISDNLDNVIEAKILSTLFQVYGGETIIIDHVTEYIDPFFDIDFQKYMRKTLNKKDLQCIFYIFSDKESILRFFSLTCNNLNLDNNKRIQIIIKTAEENISSLQEINVDHIETDISQLFKNAKEIIEKN